MTIPQMDAPSQTHLDAPSQTHRATHIILTNLTNPTTLTNLPNLTRGGIGAGFTLERAYGIRRKVMKAILISR
jgi:hypothetical protein